jgi:hypothetical protein
LTKMMWLLGQGLNPTKDWFEKSICGESD